MPLLTLLAVLLAPPNAAWTVELRPAAPGPNGLIPHIDVTLHLDLPPSPAGTPLLRLPFVVSNVDTAARAISEVSLSTPNGSARLTLRDDPAGPEAARHWLSAAPIQGPISLHYRVPISNATATRGAAPPLELRSDSGAFSGCGSTFLALPGSLRPSSVRLHWDLRHLPAGSLAVSSLGPGDASFSGPESLSRLTDGYFMAGRLHTAPARPASSGFFSAWHGEAPVDLTSLMGLEEQLYSSYRRFFHRNDVKPYVIFLRENPVNAGGGVELAGSFVTTFGPRTSASELKVTLAHEMLHTFVGGLSQPDGLESSWFSEGLAVYYARLLALRAGALSPAEFLDDLNLTAARYYTNAFLSAPNSEIPARFWADTRLRVLPYDRGSMFFAQLDERLRASSHGSRSLDHLLLRFLSHEDRSQSAWTRLLAEELGPAGPRLLQDMLAGAEMLPSPSAFGPCFTRQSKPLRRYELGFDPAVLTAQPRLVRGLLPHSAAALAGLQNGDEILQPVPQDAIQARQDAFLSLQIRRHSQTLQIRYQPRGETVDAWQWTRLPAVPDRACAW